MLSEYDNQFEIPSIVYYEIKRGLLANGATALKIEVWN
jgi:hypothetical protein